jgi:hypothetical protein
MARPRDTTRPRSVGIAIATPALRRAVAEILANSRRYEPVVFAAPDVADGAWPRGRYAAIVATPHAFRARQRHSKRRRSSSPVILVVREGSLVRERVALSAADSFVLAERLDSLASIVVLSAHRLAVMPRPKGRPAKRKK